MALSVIIKNGKYYRNMILLSDKFYAMFIELLYCIIVIG